MKKVQVLDTTLRDGEQTPGVSLSPEEKLKIAKALDDVGVDFIEAGSVATSKGEMQGMKLIAKEGLKANVLSFCRVLKKDIDLCLDCGLDGVFLVAPTSKSHIEFKLKTTEDKLLELVSETVQYSKDHGLYVDLCCEDGSRTSKDFLKKVIEAGKGIDRFTVADTVGASKPEDIAEVFTELSNQKTPLGVHCHDDLGLAVANTLAGVLNGASTVDVTVNGLGERAGNAPLEEVVASLDVLYGIKTDVDASKLYSLSALVEDLSGVALPSNKALVGKNSFTHESGIHVDGILKHPETYEFLKPEYVGRKRDFIFGKHVGGKGLEEILKNLGIKTTRQQFKEIFEKLKDMGDKGHTITDADLKAIVDSVKGVKGKKVIDLIDLLTVSGNRIRPTASVAAKIRGEEKIGSAVGNGPVDAAINAIKKLVDGTNVSLEEYHVDAITGGTDASVSVTVKVKSRGKTATASGVHSDIIMASVLAMINGLNCLLNND